MQSSGKGNICRGRPTLPRKRGFGGKKVDFSKRGVGETNLDLEEV